jgi:cytochrome c biogenesis protein CcmG, thiol:disulfide interchange protein DsbE
MSTADRAEPAAAAPAPGTGPAPAAGPDPAAGKRRERRVYALLTLAAVVVAAVISVTAAAAGQTRKPAPPPLAKAFSLGQVGRPGGRVTLAAYAGRPLVLNFFASWCNPCQRETPLLARYYSGMHGHIVVLGIDANDEPAAALRFMRRAGVRYPVGSDPYPARITTSYGVYALPQTFFLNAAHRIVAHVVGPLTMRVLTRDVALMEQDRG